MLLWGEIAGASDQYGVCTEDNGHFARLLNVDPRTIVRCMTQLVENGHIVRLDENGKRRIQVIFKVLPVPEKAGLTVVEEVTFEDIKDFANKLFSTWEAKLEVTINNKESLMPAVKRLVKMFSEEEIMQAALNKIDYARKVEFEWLKEITHFLQPESIIKYLKSN